MEEASHDERVPLERGLPQSLAIKEVFETPLPPSAIREEFELLLRRHHAEVLAQLESCLLAAGAADRRATGAGGLCVDDVAISGVAELREPRHRDTLGAEQPEAAAVAARVESRPPQHVAESAASENCPECHQESSVFITGGASKNGVGTFAKQSTQAHSKDRCRFKAKKSNKSRIMQTPYDKHGSRLLAHRIVKSAACECLITSVVLLNAVLIGVQVQMSALNRGRPLTGSWDTASFFAELIFAGIFSAELLMRIWADGLSFFWSNEWRWNWFDSFVLGLMLMQIITEMAAASLDRSVADHPAIGVLRVCRLVRLLRIVKLLRSLRELRIMVVGIVSSLRPLFWVCVLFSMILYVAGLTMTVGTVEYLAVSDAWDKEESETLISKFASLDATVLSLFEAMTGGISWGELFDASEVLSPMYQILLLAFIIFTLLGLTNIVTGVFVDSAIGHSKEDAETIIQEEMEAKRQHAEKLRAMFDEIDTNNSGSISKGQLMKAIEDTRMEAFLHRMGLDTKHAEDLFAILDRDQEGEVDTDEFLQGCMKLLGQASSLELAQVRLEGKCMLQNVVNLVQLVRDLDNKSADLGSRLEEVRRLLERRS